jgi:hypothetical protein
MRQLANIRTHDVHELVDGELVEVGELVTNLFCAELL